MLGSFVFAHAGQIGGTVVAKERTELSKLLCRRGLRQGVYCLVELLQLVIGIHRVVKRYRFQVWFLNKKREGAGQQEGEIRLIILCLLNACNFFTNRHM
jgi:hypothetical protein